MDSRMVVRAFGVVVPEPELTRHGIIPADTIVMSWHVIKGIKDLAIVLPDYRAGTIPDREKVCIAAPPLEGQGD